MAASYQVMPPLSETDYAALRADIAERGIIVPIEVDEDGEVLDGHHRVKICAELGIHCPRFVRKGMDDAAKFTHARRLNIARRHLNSEQKRALIADELRENPDRTDREIGTALGVDHKTVASIRYEMESVGEIPQQDTRTGKDGKTYKARKPIRYTLIDDTPAGVSALKGRYKEVRAGERATSRDIASGLGVGHPKVARVRADLESVGTVFQQPPPPPPPLQRHYPPHTIAPQSGHGFSCGSVPRAEAALYGALTRSSVGREWRRPRVVEAGVRGGANDYRIGWAQNVVEP